MFSNYVEQIIDGSEIITDPVSIATKFNECHINIVKIYSLPTNEVSKTLIQFQKLKFLIL